MRDQRRAPRHSFSSKQRIAGILNGRMPQLTEFQTVHCVDLSRSGFAFHQDAAPAFDHLVLLLSVNDEPTFLVARIKHSWPVNYEGRSVFRVGCEFTGRANWCPRKREIQAADGTAITAATDS